MTTTTTIKDSHDKIQSMLLAGINNLLMDVNDQQELMQKSLDDKLSKLLDLNVSLININIENQKLSTKILQKNSEILQKNSEILQKNSEMSNNLDRLLDKGGNITIQGIASSTAFTIINTIDSPGHPVKAMVFRNSCDFTIYVGINVAKSSIGPDIIDTISDDSRFTPVLANENFPMDYNTESIKNIWILSKKDKGKDTTAKFRCLLTW